MPTHYVTNWPRLKLSLVSHIRHTNEILHPLKTKRFMYKRKFSRIPCPFHYETEKRDLLLILEIVCVSLDAFRAFFEQYGTINDIVLMMDKDRRRNKGYGFVKYGDPSCVDNVMAKKGAHNLDGRMVSPPPKKKMYLSNLTDPKIWHDRRLFTKKKSWGNLH